MSLYKVSDVNEIYKNLNENLKSGFNLHNDGFVSPLSQLVTLLSMNNDYKEFLFTETKWITIMETLFSLSEHFGNKINDVSDLYLRLVRGIFLLTRNILSVNSLKNISSNDSRLYNLHFGIIKFYINIEIKKMKLALNNIILECLCNLTSLTPHYQLGNVFNINLGLDIDSFITSDVLNIVDILEIFIENLSELKNDNFALLLYFSNLVLKNDNFIQYGLRSVKFKTNIMEEFFVNQQLNQSFYESLTNSKQQNGVEELLSPKDLISLKTLKKFLIHESMPGYLKSLNIKNKSEESFQNHLILSNWIKSATILLCSVYKYDSFELTNIMIWVIMFMDDFCADVNTLFDTYKINDITTEFIDKEITPFLDFLYEDLVNILDLLSFLLQFEHSQKFLIHYKGVEKLSKLLQTFQINCYKLSVYVDEKDGNTLKLNDNLKKNDNYKNWQKVIDTSENKIKSLNFPHCKSLIIEILNKLLIIENEGTETLDNIYNLQEQFRELGVLEITLSNCGIDDNEPFIKERCIMFLKHLLYKNSQNQNMVAELEQRKKVDSESESLLEEIGYEVDINDDGKIGLKKQSI
ncbi:hypothetical protein QEN19_003693 [Hanseniaspora menglaensis]